MHRDSSCQNYPAKRPGTIVIQSTSTPRFSMSKMLRKPYTGKHTALSGTFVDASTTRFTSMVVSDHIATERCAPSTDSCRARCVAMMVRRPMISRIRSDRNTPSSASSMKTVSTTRWLSLTAQLGKGGHSETIQSELEESLATSGHAYCERSFRSPPRRRIVLIVLVGRSTQDLAAT